MYDFFVYNVGKNMVQYTYMFESYTWENIIFGCEKKLVTRHDDVINLFIFNLIILNLNDYFIYN